MYHPCGTGTIMSLPLPLRAKPGKIKQPKAGWGFELSQGGYRACICIYYAERNNTTPFFSFLRGKYKVHRLGFPPLYFDNDVQLSAAHSYFIGCQAGQLWFCLLNSWVSPETHPSTCHALWLEKSAFKFSLAKLSVEAIDKCKLRSKIPPSGSEPSTAKHYH